MKRWISRVVLITAACLMLAGTLAYQVKVATPAHAMALASCNGSSCTNVDPYQANCWDGSASYFYYQYSGGWEKFWYSPTCHSNWTEGQAYSGNAVEGFFQDTCPHNQFDSNGNCTASGQIHYCEGHTNVTGCYPRQDYNIFVWDIPTNGATHWYTNMVDGTWKARGQVIFASGSLDSGWH